MNQLAYHIGKERYCKRTPALTVTVLRKFQSILVINSGRRQRLTCAAMSNAAEIEKLFQKYDDAPQNILFVKV